MAGDLQIQVGPGPEDPGRGPRPAAGASSSPPQVRGGGRWRLVLAVVAALALAGGGLTVVPGGSDGDLDSDGPGPTPEGQATPPRPPRIVWAQAATRLGEAGAFAYRGTVRATGPGPLRPGAWLAADVIVEVAVLLPRSITREVAVDGRGRAVETVTSGPTAWSRTAPDRDRLDAAPWRVTRAAEPMPGGWTDEAAPPRLGVALVSTALRAATNRRMDPPGAGGRRVLHGTVPAGARDPAVEALPDEAEVSLTLGENGDVTTIRLASAAADRRALVIDLTVDRVGEPGLVTAADVGEPARRSVPLDVLAALGVEPVELGRVPPGWALTDAQVASGRVRCAALVLQYEELAGIPGRQLSVTVPSDRCGIAKGRAPAGRAFRAGPFRGRADERAGGGTHGSVSNGTTTVQFATDLAPADAAAVLASLRPFDPSRAVR